MSRTRQELRCPGYRYTPYIDQLPENWLGRAAILSHYRAQVGDEHDLADAPPRERWQDDRAATVLYVADLLVEGKTEREILEMFEIMLPIEKAFLKRANEWEILHAALAP